MKRWLPFLPLAVLAALGVLFAGYALHHDPQVAPNALVGQPLPAAPMPALAGGAPVSLKSQLQGPTLINVFASWCAPCAVEAPELMKMKADGVRIVGVAYEDTPPKGSHADTQAFLNRLGDPYAVRLADDDGNAGIEFSKGRKGDALIVAVRCRGKGTMNVAVQSVHVSFTQKCLATETSTTYNQVKVAGVDHSGVVSVEAPSAVRWSLTVGRGRPGQEEPPGIS